MGPGIYPGEYQYHIIYTLNNQSPKCKHHAQSAEFYAYSGRWLSIVCDRTMLVYYEKDLGWTLGEHQYYYIIYHQRTSAQMLALCLLKEKKIMDVLYTPEEVHYIIMEP